MNKLAILTVVAAGLALAGTARPAEVEVKLLNKGSEGAVMVYEPAFVKVAPGDTVKFVSTDKGHNAESIKGMLPEGAAAFVRKNGEDIAVKFDQEGIYGVECLPHYGMGMVAMIVVGTPSNLDQAKAVPRSARPSRRSRRYSTNSKPARSRRSEHLRPPASPVSRMNEHRLVRPDVVPHARFAPARKAQRLDADQADLAEFEATIIGGKRDRKPTIARGGIAHGGFLCRRMQGPH
jgi:pseudoazurin